MLALAPVTVSAQIAPFCTQLADLLTASQSGAAVQFTLETTANCTRSLNLGAAPSVDCAWPFDYRSDAATNAFLSLVEAVATCASPIEQTGPAVSHPDSYDLRQFAHPGGIISVSLKDKGALSETYVFLRAQSRSTP